MATVVLRAAEVLDLNLPTVETKQTILTEVLQPRHNGVEHLLPFNDTLTDILLDAWLKPCTGALVTCLISRRHRPALGTQRVGCADVGGTSEAQCLPYRTRIGSQNGWKLLEADLLKLQLSIVVGEYCIHSDPFYPQLVGLGGTCPPLSPR